MTTTHPDRAIDDHGVVGVVVVATLAFVTTFALALPLMFATNATPAVGAGIATTPPSALAISEIPPYLLPHYQSAPACAGLPWQIIAAIGYQESRHGQGRIDPATGNTTPPILGPALNGTGGAMAIPATPASTAYTGDPHWDHAIGPMQFLTATWQAWATDGNGDGTANPNNAYDAIATAGRYLCNGQSTLDSIGAAIRRYNNSPTYEADVINKAFVYGMTTAGTSPTNPATPNGPGPGPGATMNGNLAEVINFAVAQLGKPYQWGATGPNSYDCSGLTQTSYAAAGIHIGRVTTQQATNGTPINWHTQPLHPGDLIFMPDGTGQPLGHVGMALDATHMIQAPHTGTTVQISPIPFPAIQTIRRIIN